MPSAIELERISTAGSNMKHQKGRLVNEEGMKKRYMYLTLAMIQSFLATGVVWGWISLERIMLDSEVYADLCDQPSKKRACSAQADRILLVYTVGAFTTQTSTVIFGPLFDHIGPKKCSVISLAIFILGCMLFAFADKDFDVYIPAFGLIGLAGPGSQVSLYHNSNLFPDRRAQFMSTISAFFTVSSMVFVIFEGLYWTFKVTIKQLFIGYSIMVFIVMIAAWILWPNKPWTAARVKNQRTISCEPAQKPRFRTILFSRIFVLFTIWCLLVAVWPVYFLGTAGDRYKAIEDYEGQSDTYAEILTIMVPLGSISIPLYGIIVDHYGPSSVLLLCTLTGMLYSASLFLTSLGPLHLLAQVCFILSRGAYATCKNSFPGTVFNFQHYGKLYGIVAFLTALVSLLQYPINYYLEDDYYIPNLVQICCMCVALPLVMYMHTLLVEHRRKLSLTLELATLPMPDLENMAALAESSLSGEDSSMGDGVGAGSMGVHEGGMVTKDPRAPSDSARNSCEYIEMRMDDTGTHTLSDTQRFMANDMQRSS